MYISSSDEWRPDSGGIQPNPLGFFDSHITLTKSNLIKDPFKVGINLHKRKGKRIGTAFGLPMQSTTDNSKLNIILACSLRKHQWF
jgi:hypothetical protein